MGRTMAVVECLEIAARGSLAFFGGLAVIPGAASFGCSRYPFGRLVHNLHTARPAAIIPNFKARAEGAFLSCPQDGGRLDAFDRHGYRAAGHFLWWWTVLVALCLRSGIARPLRRGSGAPRRFLPFPLRT